MLVEILMIWMLFCFDSFVSNLSFNVVTKHFIIHMKDYYNLWPHQSLTWSLAQGFCFEGRLARPVDGWHGAGSMRQTILALIHWAKAEWCIQRKENTHHKTHLLSKRNSLEVLQDEWRPTRSLIILVKNNLAKESFLHIIIICLFNQTTGY